MLSDLAQVVVEGTGMYVPKRIMTNEDAVAKLAGYGITNTPNSGPITPQKIFEITGVRERHIAGWDENTSDLAYHAAVAAIENAGIEAKDISFIRVASSTHEKAFPATACLVQQKLGIKGPGAYDISGACAGFALALRSAYHTMLCEPDAKYGLVIGAEVIASRMTDWRSDLNADLWGDGAGAVVLRRQTNKNQPVRGIMATEEVADGSLAGITESVGFGTRRGDRAKRPNAWMDGHPVFRFAVSVMAEITETVIRKAGINKEEVALVIPHQANSRIIETAARKLGMPVEKFYMNIDRYGNTSSASIPIALHEAVTDGRVNNGDHVVLVGFGGGMSAGAVLMRW